MVGRGTHEALPDERNDSILVYINGEFYRREYRAIPGKAQAFVAGVRADLPTIAGLRHQGLNDLFWRRLVRRGESAGLLSARRESTDSSFAPGLSRITSEIKATITFTVSNSGEPRPVPSPTPPWESSIIALRAMPPRAARLVSKPRMSAMPSVNSPTRMSWAKSSAF